MKPNANRLAIALLTVALAACGGGGADETAMVADTTGRDLSLAGADSTAQPQLQDVPVTSSTAAPAPATKSPPPAKAGTPKQEAPPPAAPPAAEPAKTPAGGVIAAGTSLTLASAAKVCTNTNKVGDRFNAVLAAAVMGTNGVSLPESSLVAIEITELHGSNSKDQQIAMGFRVVSITAGGQTWTPDAEVVSAQIDQVRAQTSGDAAKKVAGGAAAGAIVGQILGRNRRGTVIGAAVGAAAGAAAAKAGGDDYDGCIEAGSPITVKLNAPLSIAK